MQNLSGVCLSMLGRPDEALAAFTRATELNPGYVEAHLNRAITLNDLGRLDEARDSFARAAEADEEKGGGGRFSSAAAARLANLHARAGGDVRAGRRAARRRWSSTAARWSCAPASWTSAPAWAAR